MFRRLKTWIQAKTQRRPFSWADLTLAQYQQICCVQRIYQPQKEADGEDARQSQSMLALRILSILLNKSFDQLTKRTTPYRLGQLAARHTKFLGTPPPMRLVSAFRMGKELFSIPSTYDHVPLYQWLQIESNVLKKPNSPDSADDLATFLAVACVQPATAFSTERIPELAAKFRNVKFLTAIGMRAFFLLALKNSSRNTNPFLPTTATAVPSKSTPKVSGGWLSSLIWPGRGKRVSVYRN
jgi:hypothetical protein